MPYIFVENFKFGLDRRRKRVAGVPGTLWTLENAHITRGGDIERAKKFVAKHTLPTGTFALAQIRNQLFAFGSGDLSASMPLGVQYQRLESPNAAAMSDVLDVKTFDGNFYVIAEYVDGNVHHFFNGARVTDWDTIADANASFEVLVSRLADKINNDAAVSAVANGQVLTLTARTTGTAFTIAQSTVDNGGTDDETITLAELQANVPAQAETRATGTLTVTGGTVNPGGNQFTNIVVDGTSILLSVVDFVTDNDTTAAAIAQAINNGNLTHGYQATSAGAVVTITAPVGSGVSLNGEAIVPTWNGDAASTQTNLTGGALAITAVAQVNSATFAGTFESTDQFNVTVDGTAYTSTGRGAATGRSAFVTKNRVWSPSVSLWRFCKLNDPTDWTDTDANTGAGFINVSTETDGAQDVITAAPYDTLVAVFTEGTTHLYSVNADAAQTSYVRTLNNTGTQAPRSPVAYGNNEVFYLDSPGVRSLRSKSTTDAPFTAGIGAPIDSFLREHLQTLARDVPSQAQSAIEPEEGRLWVTIGDRIYVLSFFSEEKINAWSIYKPGFDPSWPVRTKERMFVRGGDVVYEYGGADDATYPDAGEQIVTVELPFLSAQEDATVKNFEGYDTALSNTWDVDLLPDPNDETQTVSVGRLHEITYGQPHVKNPFRAAMAAVKLTCDKAGNASLSSLAIHYSTAEAQ